MQSLEIHLSHTDVSEAPTEEQRSVSEVGTQTDNPKTGCKMTQTEKENLKTKSIQCQCDMSSNRCSEIAPRM